MPELSVDHHDFDVAAKALEDQNLKRLLGAAINPAMRGAANLVRKNVRAALRPHNRTGRMRDHVRVKVQGRGLDTIAGVRTTGVASNLVIGGVRPHAISPGRVMPLWGGRRRSAGITGFATAVEHPGFRGDPFFATGLKASEAGINALVADAAEKMVTSLADAMKG